MKKVNNSKEKLIKYLQSHQGTDISRETIIEQTKISKSRLSELIKELRKDGYSICTPNRSGIVRLDSSNTIQKDISAKHVRQWILLFVLSQTEQATYKELIFKILSIIDYSYQSEDIFIDKQYSDSDILSYLSKYHIALKDDLKQFLPLPTLRKDLQELCQMGFIEKKRKTHHENTHVVYSLSEKAPLTLFESEDELCNFMVYYNNVYGENKATSPLASVYNKISVICAWDGYDSYTRNYGKAKNIEPKQLEFLNVFLKHPYKTHTLAIKYKGKKKIIDYKIETGLIFYSIETSCFYILGYESSENNTIQLRLDSFESITDTLQPNTYYHSTDIQKKYQEMFSSSYDSRLTHVKVLFEDFGNIIERITVLHQQRKESKLYQLEEPIEGIPHSFVYEDDLRGISAFERYLRSFGSSALVIEPDDLREKIINSNNKILNHYKGENNAQ